MVEENGEQKETLPNTPVVETVAKISPTAMADRAIEAATRLEKANENTEKNLDRQEALLARQMLSGQTEAGVQSREKTQAEIDKEEADKILAYED